MYNSLYGLQLSTTRTCGSTLHIGTIILQECQIEKHLVSLQMDHGRFVFAHNGSALNTNPTLLHMRLPTIVRQHSADEMSIINVASGLEY